MTTEEKAKAYDEAIGKAAALYKASEPMSGCNIIIETLFPELKESEDERIRKELLEHCKNQAEPYIQTGNEYPQIQSWITWLEKQGEKDILEDAILDGNEDGLIAETIRYKNEKQGEQKPAWSEEEERYICQLESMVKERWALAEKAQDEEVIKNMSNLAFFLKTLNPNKKPADEEMKTLLRTEYEKGRADAIAEMQMEWSEEDEKILEIITSVLQVNFESTERFSGYEEYMNVDLINWLKSLRPQNHWKPSDEQMKILLQAVAYFGVSWVNKDYLALQSLYFDLKKLKEE